MPFGCVSCADRNQLDHWERNPRRSSMPFGCVSCADMSRGVAPSYGSRSLQCLSAVCPVRTAWGVAWVALDLLDVFNAFRLCVLCGPRPTLSIFPLPLLVFNGFRLCVLCGHETFRPLIPTVKKSSMPFGCVSCADHGSEIPSTPDTWSSMPFGCVSCADTTKIPETLKRRPVVFNAFRLCVLCGRDSAPLTVEQFYEVFNAFRLCVLCGHV